MKDCSNASFVAEKNQCELEHSIFIDMRSALGRMPDQLFDVIARSIQIITWSKDHQFCGSCGSSMHPHVFWHFLATSASFLHFFLFFLQNFLLSMSVQSFYGKSKEEIVLNETK